MMLPRIFRFRYTLRALLVFITLFALWGGYHANRAARERASERFLKDRGARLTYRPHGINLFRYRFVGEVHQLAQFDGATARALRDLPFLTALGLESPQSSEPKQWWQSHEARARLTGSMFADFLAKSSLWNLQLGGFVIDDEACTAIGRHPTLTSLALNECQVSEDGLAELVQVPRLESLSVMYSSPTGSALSDVPGSNTLRDANFDCTPLCVEAAAFLARCRNLRSLSVWDSYVGHKRHRISDDFLERLGSHASLEVLSLGGASITERSARVLTSMPALRLLSLPESFPPAAREQLKSANPQLQGL